MNFSRASSPSGSFSSTYSRSCSTSSQMFSRTSPWSLPEARCLAVSLPLASSFLKSTPCFRSSLEGRDASAASLALSARLLAASAKISRVSRITSDPICLNSGEVTIKLAIVRKDSMARLESRESSLEEAGTEAALMSISISAWEALYWNVSVSPFEYSMGRCTYEEVLKQVIAVLLVTPLSGSLQDVLDVLEDPGSLGTESCSSGVGSTAALERVGVDDEFEHLG